MLNWFGHQSRFVVPPPAAWLNGHFASVDIFFSLLTVWRIVGVQPLSLELRQPRDKVCAELAAFAAAAVSFVSTH